MQAVASAQKIVRFGVFEVDLRAGELRRKGARVRLQEQPLQVLALLLQHPGQIVTREEFRRTLWNDGIIVDFDHSLNTTVNKLREALGDTADSSRFIETLPRRGYRFICPLNSEIQATDVIAPPSAPWRRPCVPFGAFLAVLLAVFALNVRQVRDRLRGRPVGVEPRSIAVL